MNDEERLAEMERVYDIITDVWVNPKLSQMDFVAIFLMATGTIDAATVVKIMGMGE